MSYIYTNNKSGKTFKKNKWTGNRGHQKCLKWQQLDYFPFSCYYTVITVLAESWLLWMKNHQSAQSKTVTGSSQNPRRRLRPLKSGLETWNHFSVRQQKAKMCCSTVWLFQKKKLFFLTSFKVCVMTASWSEDSLKGNPAGEQHEQPEGGWKKIIIEMRHESSDGVAMLNGVKHSFHLPFTMSPFVLIEKSFTHFWFFGFSCKHRDSLRGHFSI